MSATVCTTAPSADQPDSELSYELGLKLCPFYQVSQTGQTFDGECFQFPSQLSKLSMVSGG